GCAKGSPLPVSASRTEARPSASRLAVWVESREVRMSGEPSTSVATLTSEANGWPVLRSSVPSVPARTLRSSVLARATGSKPAGARAPSGRRSGIAPGSGCAILGVIQFLPNASSATIFLKSATIAPVAGRLLGTGAGRVFARPIHARRPPMPTIALVDDDRNILTSVSIALESEGYRIMTYTDGASALEGFKTSPPDLAILDIKMPR